MGKNIHRINSILMGNTILVMVLIGNYVHGVNVIKGSLYSRVYDSWWSIGFC